jgi:broad specificity phosphatase PhoE
LARDAQALRLDLAVNDAEVPLSARGREQAKALGRWLGAQPDEQQPTMVLVSPYQRAQETARIVLEAAGISSLPVRYDERLRDREQGVLDRLTAAGFREAYPAEAERQSYVGKFWYRPPSGESWADVVLRLRSFLLETRLTYCDERLLLVLHDMPILGLRYVIESMTTAEVLALGGTLANCSLTRYEHRGGDLALVSAGDTSPVDEWPLVEVTTHE